MEEERRICYVAITRAEELLLYHKCNDQNVVWSFSIQYAISILKEIPEDLLDSHTGQKDKLYLPNLNLKEVLVSVLHQLKQVSSSDWKVGDKVMHKAWGEGMVSNVNEKNGSVELDIIFKSEGPKRLLAQFAPITKKEDS